MVAFLILLLFAIIFLVAGGVLLYFRNRSQQKAGLMTQTETSNASDVSSLAPGTLVEVKGTLRCEEPRSNAIGGVVIHDVAHARSTKSFERACALVAARCGFYQTVS